MTEPDGASILLRMGEFVLLGLALAQLGAAFLLYRAGGRFENRRQRASLMDLERDVASLHADYISHVRSDAGRAGVEAKKAKAAATEMVQPAGNPGAFFERQAQTDPEGARRGILDYFRARDAGNGGK